MDLKDRGKIQDNLDELVRLTKWNAVLENCVVRNGNLKKIMNTVRVSGLLTFTKSISFLKRLKKWSKFIRLLKPFLNGGFEALIVHQKNSFFNK